MYFLSELEHKLLIHKLLPTAREAPVTADLRGWNWHQPPVKPFYEEGVPMYAVNSKYCPSGRDVFLRYVKHVKPELNQKIALGKLLHGVVSDSLLSLISRKQLSFEDWWGIIRWEEISLSADREEFRRKALLVWDYVHKIAEARYASVSGDQPFASELDLLQTAYPFLIEHKISGKLLGLSDILSLDCYDYLRNIMFDLKVEAGSEEWQRLAPTGYALVFESIHEVPVDVGCVVHLSFQGDRLTVKKDLFHINDDLRSEWVEERDKKLEIVAQKKDPGCQGERSQACLYYPICQE